MAHYGFIVYIHLPQRIGMLHALRRQQQAHVLARLNNSTGPHHRCRCGS
jgi:hypothetical protein